MAEFINTIDVLGDEVVAERIILRTITEFKDDTITSLGVSSFSHSSLQEIDCPEVLTVEISALSDCSSLSIVTLPKAQKIAGRVFEKDSSLTTLSFPNVTEIETDGLRSCQYLTSLSLPKLEKLGITSIYGCTNLVSITLPATPPTIQTSSIEYINKSCVFHIPAGSLSAYQSATNWSALIEKYTFTEDA